jgi:hypothetical protein
MTESLLTTPRSLIIHSYATHISAEIQKQYFDSCILHANEKLLALNDTKDDSVTHSSYDYRIMLCSTTVCPMKWSHVPDVIVCDSIIQLNSIHSHIYRNTTMRNSTWKPFIIMFAHSIDDVESVCETDFPLTPDILFCAHKHNQALNPTRDQDLDKAAQLWTNYTKEQEKYMTLEWIRIQLKSGVSSYDEIKSRIQQLDTLEQDITQFYLPENLNDDSEIRFYLQLLYYHIQAVSVFLGQNVSTLKHEHQTLRSARASICRVIKEIDFRKKERQQWIDLLFTFPPLDTSKSLYQAVTPIQIVNLTHRKDLMTTISRQLDTCGMNVKYRRFEGTVYGYQELDALYRDLFCKYPKAFNMLALRCENPLTKEETQNCKCLELEKSQSTKIDLECWASHIKKGRLDLGELGLWLSEIRILEQMKEATLILENRAVLGSVFARDWPAFESCMKALEGVVDLAWPGYHVENGERAEMMLDTSVENSAPVAMSLHPVKRPVMKRVYNGGGTPMTMESKMVSLPCFIGGTFVMYIPMCGRDKLLKILRGEDETAQCLPIIFPIDVLLMQHLPKSFKQFACKRPLVWHSYKSGGGDIINHQRNN